MGRREKRTRSATAEVKGIAEQIVELRSMTVAQLHARHSEVFGVPTRSRNKAFLVKRIAWRIQEQAEGGLSARAEERLADLAPIAPARHNRPPSSSAGSERDPRLPPVGTEITRRYKGIEYRVAVLANGFEYDGKAYQSLSAIALAITGTVWNGHLFFGLKKRGKSGKDGT